MKLKVFAVLLVLLVVGLLFFCVQRKPSVTSYEETQRIAQEAAVNAINFGLLQTPQDIERFKKEYNLVDDEYTELLTAFLLYNSDNPQTKKQGRSILEKIKQGSSELSKRIKNIP
ncbi:MAG: hypothetical protein LBV69_05215, partial [Bacteroidales bacterium]|nr:hypothetical protein [Bacteroidales bacterium]